MSQKNAMKTKVSTASEINASVLQERHTKKDCSELDCLDKGNVWVLLIALASLQKNHLDVLQIQNVMGKGLVSVFAKKATLQLQKDTVAMGHSELQDRRPFPFT